MQICDTMDSQAIVNLFFRVRILHAKNRRRAGMEPRPPRATSARIMAVTRSIRSRSRAALWIMTNFQSLRHKVTAQDGDHGKFALLSVHNGARDLHDHGHGWPRWPRVAAVPYSASIFRV